MSYLSNEAIVSAWETYPSLECKGRDGLLTPSLASAEGRLEAGWGLLPPVHPQKALRAGFIFLGFACFLYQE